MQWPPGFDATIAATYIADYEAAKNIARLYTNIESQIEESEPIQIVQAPLTLEAEPSEPGPLPEVSGNRRDSSIRNIPTLNIRPKRRCISLREYKDRKSS